MSSPPVICLWCYIRQIVLCVKKFVVSQALLCVLSVLQSRGVPLGLFEGHVAEDQLPYSVLFSTGGLADALGPLLEEDLVRQQPDGSLDVHNMVQHSSRALLSAGPEQTVLDTFGTLFADRFIAGSKQAHRTGLKSLVGCVHALQPCLIFEFASCSGVQRPCRVTECQA